MLWREASKREKRRLDRRRQRDAVLRRECPFAPNLLSSDTPTALAASNPRYPNEMAADRAAAAAAEEAVEGGTAAEDTGVVPHQK